MSIRETLALATILCAAAVTPLVGQQVQDSAGVAPSNSVPAVSAPEIPAPAIAPSTTLPGPRLTPRFQPVEPRLAPSTTSQGFGLAVAGGQHVIVVSTLALVLATIIIVLLVVN